MIDVLHALGNESSVLGQDAALLAGKARPHAHCVLQGCTAAQSSQVMCGTQQRAHDAVHVASKHQLPLGQLCILCLMTAPYSNCIPQPDGAEQADAA